MPYIGNTSPSRFVSNRAASVYSGDGSTTAFTLEQAVVQDEDVLVSVDGVIQEPSVAYAVSNGTTLTFTGAPSSNSGNNIFVYYLASQVGTVGHPSNQALNATSGTFTGNIIIPNSGNIGSVGDTDAVTITSAGLVGLNNPSPASALAVNADLNDQWAGRFVNTNSGGYGVLSRTTASTTNDIAFRVDKNGTETALNVDGAGNVTKPYQPAFLVRTGTGGNATNVPINGTTIVDFGTEVFDRGADFSTNTFTAPVTGLYQINFSGVFSQMDTASTYVELIIQCSNRNFNWTIDPDVFDQDAVYFPVNISCLADMDASDVAKIGISLPNDGTAQMDLVNYAYFSGYLVA